MARKSLKSLKRSTDPWNLPNFHMTVVLVHVKRWKKFEGCKRKLSLVRHQTCIVPSRNHEPSSELLRFVRGVCPNFGQTCQIFYHIILVHDITSTKVSCVSDLFLFFGIKMPCHSMLNCVIAVRPICSEIPSNLLHMELNRTQVHEIWVFKPLWIAVAWRCSSNLNYGH